MYAKMIRLHFPIASVQRPIVCNLVKDYGLTFNILNAAVYPRKEGVMVMELIGAKKDYLAGIRYLKSQGVRVKAASQEIRRIEENCVQCGACTAVCPTGALSVVRPQMTVRFDQEICSVCELCIPACPTRAMVARPTNTSFF